MANLRTGPSRRAELVRQAYENEPLRVVGARGDWLRVRDAADGAAWINSDLIDGRPTVVVVRDVVNVREQPGTGFPIVFTAERGVNLLVLERSGRWLRVRARGCVGTCPWARPSDVQPAERRVPPVAGRES